LTINMKCEKIPPHFVDNCQVSSERMSIKLHKRKDFNKNISGEIIEGSAMKSYDSVNMFIKISSRGR
jgi:hypothetical protein